MKTRKHMDPKARRIAELRRKVTQFTNMAKRPGAAQCFIDEDLAEAAEHQRALDKLVNA